MQVAIDPYTETEEFKRKARMYSGAYDPSIRAHCSLHGYSPSRHEFLCNFGHADVWRPAGQLKDFVL